MKRTIVCKECEVKLRKLFPKESPYPGEHVKFVSGKAMCHFRCNDCNIIIEKGDPACAVSMWSEQDAAPYPWEDEFIASMEPDQSASALPTLEEVKKAYCKYWFSQHTRVPESAYNVIEWCYDYMREKL